MAEIFGTNSPETIYGSAYDDNIYGLGGDDVIYGRGGHDLLDGGDGDDQLFGGYGNDILLGGSGINDLWGGSGYDLFAVRVRTTAAFSDDLVGDFQFDIDWVDLRAWGVSDFSQVLALLGTDSLGDATLNAYYAGQDHILTFNEVAPGELIASDFIFADPAAITATGTSAGDVMFGSRLNDSLNGGGGFDILLGGMGSDKLYGGAGNDDLVGGEGSDFLYGGGGSDLLQGNAGQDFLRGDAGRDFLEGGSGNDRLRGGIGTDDLEGGAGADRFIFDDGEFGGLSSSTADYIADFSRSEGDRIDLALVDAKSGGADDAFTFIGTASFSGSAGQLRYYQSDGATFVAGDLNGDRVADFLIMVEGTLSLSAGDFLL